MVKFLLRAARMRDVEVTAWWTARGCFYKLEWMDGDRVLSEESGPFLTLEDAAAEAVKRYDVIAHELVEEVEE